MISQELNNNDILNSNTNNDLDHREGISFLKNIVKNSISLFIRRVREDIAISDDDPNHIIKWHNSFVCFSVILSIVFFIFMLIYTNNSIAATFISYYSLGLCSVTTQASCGILNFLNTSCGNKKIPLKIVKFLHILGLCIWFILPYILYYTDNLDTIAPYPSLKSCLVYASFCIGMSLLIIFPSFIVVKAILFFKLSSVLGFSSSYGSLSPDLNDVELVNLGSTAIPQYPGIINMAVRINDHDIGDYSDIPIAESSSVSQIQTG